MPNAAIASLTTYSRSTGPSAARPFAAARKRCAARSFELDITPDALLVDDLAEQDGTSVAQLRHEMAELVARVSHRD
jgi:hypothetical protein